VLSFYPSDDATVQEGAPDATDPSSLYLAAGHNENWMFPQWADGRVRFYLRFDLSTLPADSAVISATLSLYHSGGADYEGCSSSVNFHPVTGNWDESTITWNNCPGCGASTGSVSTTTDDQGWVNVDLTAQVAAWAAGGQPNYGLAGIGPEGTPGLLRLFLSGESGLGPELRVSYGPAPPPTLDVSPTTLSARATNTQPPPPSSIQISNATYGSLDWAATKIGGATWLALSKSSGSATPASPDSLDLTVDASGLVLGEYVEQVLISSDTPEVVGSPVTITFTLEVVDQLNPVYLPCIVRTTPSSPSPLEAASHQHTAPFMASVAPDD